MLDVGKLRYSYTERVVLLMHLKDAEGLALIQNSFSLSTSKSITTTLLIQSVAKSL